MREGHVMNHQNMLKPMLVGLAVFVGLGLAGLPVLNYLPFLIFLVCPIMMIFMMGGHGHANERDDDGQPGSSHTGHDRQEER